MVEASSKHCLVVSASGGTSLGKAFHTFQAALRMCSSPLPAEEAASSSLSALFFLIEDLMWGLWQSTLTEDRVGHDLNHKQPHVWSQKLKVTDINRPSLQATRCVQACGCQCRHARSAGRRAVYGGGAMTIPAACGSLNTDRENHRNKHDFKISSHCFETF